MRKEYDFSKLKPSRNPYIEMKSPKNPLGHRFSVRAKKSTYACWFSGRGPLVVLLHGWPVNSRHWQKAVPSLVKAGFQCLCVDLKGLGESTTTDSDFTKKQIAKEVLEIVERFHGKKESFSVIGHDWGGSIGIAMAAIAPQKILRLIVEDEIPPGLSVPLTGKSIIHYPTWHGAFHRVPKLPEKLIASQNRDYINYFLDLRFKSSSLIPKDRKHYLDCYQSATKTRNGLAYYRCSEDDSRFFSLLEKRKLNTPVLVIAGDSGMGAAVPLALKKIFKNVRAMVFNNCGHYPAEEYAIRFSRSAIRFLGRKSYT